MRKPKRSEDQVMITFPASRRLLDEIESVRGVISRAQFIRMSIAKYLSELGVELPQSEWHAPDRVGKGGKPSHKRHHLTDEITPKQKQASTDEPRYHWPFKGLVAAGKSHNFDHDSEETIPVSKPLKKNHFLVRVNGNSMLPTYQDGDLIEVRMLKDGEFPKKRKAYVWCLESEGFVLKRLIYTKDGKKNEDGSPRRATPHLASDNPEFPEVCPIGEARAVGEVVEVISSPAVKS